MPTHNGRNERRPHLTCSARSDGSGVWVNIPHRDTQYLLLEEAESLRDEVTAALEDLRRADLSDVYRKHPQPCALPA